MLLLAFACVAPEPEPAEPGPPAPAPTTPPAPTSPPTPPEPTVPTTPAAAPDATCEVPGCLRSEQSLGTYERADIEPFLYGGVTITNGYEIVVVEYWTEAGPATATVTLPVDPVEPAPPDGWPVVVNAHGTVGLDDPCRLSTTVSGTGLAALFGGRGAIGVAPDYPGLGTPGIHRYLEARSEGTSVLDAIRATIALAAWRAVPTNERAAVVGLSQGGHASLAAAALHAEYAPELDIRAFAASGPASVYEEHWRSGVLFDGEHLVYHALLAWSFAEASGLDDAGVWAPALAARVDQHLTTRCNWSPDFTSEPLLVDDFPTVAEDVFSPAYLAEYETGDWSTFSAIHDRFEDNRLRPWAEQTAPIRIWQGALDSTVLATATTELVDDLRAGGIDVELTIVPGGTHTTTAFGFLAYPELATAESVSWVFEQLDAP